MAAHMSLKQKQRIRAKAEKVQAQMFKNLIKLIPHHWDGQVNLAYEAGVSPQTLWMWVEGRTTSPRINTMVKVASALGFTIELVRPTTKLRLVKS